MITDALLSFAAWVVETITGWMPTVAPPSWTGDVSSTLQELLTTAAAMDTWIPVAFGLQMLGAVLACLLVGLGIKVVRIVASFFTAGGGSAG